MTAALLSVTGLHARYGRVEVLHGVDLHVDDGEKVALLGPNGAGKTTLLRAISRTVRSRGSVVFADTDLSRTDPAAAARLGLGHVPSGRGTFTELTVAENLRLGQLAATGPGASPAVQRTRAADLDAVLAAFPMLTERTHQLAGSMSGGQQQQLALARALLGRPRLLLVDEPSLGLAPLVTAQLFTTLAQLQRQWGLAVLLAEQNARLSLDLCDRAYVLAGGRVALSGDTSLIGPEDLHAAYLGTNTHRPHERKEVLNG
jgi:branched-chain amino acid transport system ATP-binding protein